MTSFPCGGEWQQLSVLVALARNGVYNTFASCLPWSVVVADEFIRSNNWLTGCRVERLDFTRYAPNTELLRTCEKLCHLFSVVRVSLLIWR